MPNRYVEFVKEYAIKNKLGWNCAVCEIKEKGLYKPVKTLSVKAKEPEKIIIKKKKKKEKNLNQNAMITKEPEKIIIKKKRKKRKKFKPKCYVNHRSRKNS